MAPNDDLNRWLVDQYTEIARLAGGLAHEIKNPLSTIRMNMELLAEDFRDSDDARDRRAMKKVELVQQECRRLQDLLDNFLQFSKAHRLNLQPSDLNAQVRQVLDFYRPKARQSGVEVAEYLTGSLPTVLLDREAFHGALLNLVLNAEQAMPQGGQLVVRTYGTPDGVALDLIDTGCGMDAQTRARVFDAFFSTKRGGSGLGLPTTRKIIEGHGGAIALQSELGRGTQVTLKLPVPARLPADGGVKTSRLCFSITYTRDRQECLSSWFGYEEGFFVTTPCRGLPGRCRSPNRSRGGRTSRGLAPITGRGCRRCGE